MEFCDQCDNLLTLAKDKGNEGLHYHCRSCKTNTECPPNFSPCVYQKNYGGNEKVFYEMFVNKYTKHDPSLPHVHTTECQNKECIGKKEKQQPDIVYVRYSDDKMKYIYLCCHCDKAWIHPEYQKIEFILN